MCKCALSLFSSNKIAAQLLLSLDRLEQRLEVSSAKAGEVVSLDDLDEHSGAVHHVLVQGLAFSFEATMTESTYLGEQLKQIATLVKVNQDVQALNSLKVFLQH